MIKKGLVYGFLLLIIISIIFMLKDKNIFVDEMTDVVTKDVDTNRHIVQLDQTVDGDTAKLILNGQSRTYRFLLIDTPETKHPKLGVQPYGKEASNRTLELLTSAKKIEVEYDIGPKNDKYGRNLAYVYVDGKMLNGILVSEGLAKVGYVYPPNTKYLDDLQRLEKKARGQGLGIWSGKKPKEVIVKTTATHKENRYENCTDLRQDYPNGVKNTHAAYRKSFDRDGDMMACEL